MGSADSDKSFLVIDHAKETARPFDHFLVPFYLKSSTSCHLRKLGSIRNIELFEVGASVVDLVAYSVCFRRIKHEFAAIFCMH